MLQAFIVLAYRQEQCVEAACLSALRQDCEPLEIILSDDCSPDRTGEVMARVAAEYSGPHKVRFRQSARNRGLIGHLQDVVAETRAELIIGQAGDDQSEPHRAAEIFKAWNDRGRPTSLICSDFIGVDEQGRELPGSAPPGPFPIERLAEGISGPMGCTSAFSRTLITDFPELPRDMIHEDRVLPFRAWLAGGEVIYLDQRLLRYCMVGGVSRNLPADTIDYLFRFCREIAERTLPDARIRLSEAETFGAPAHVVALCRGNLALLEAQSAMSNAQDLTQKFLSAIRLGAPLAPLARHYLKAMFLRGKASTIKAVT